jgi:hypothetical protein
LALPDRLDLEHLGPALAGDEEVTGFVQPSPHSDDITLIVVKAR